MRNSDEASCLETVTRTCRRQQHAAIPAGAGASAREAGIRRPLPVEPGSQCRVLGRILGIQRYARDDALPKRADRPGPHARRSLVRGRPAELRGQSAAPRTSGDRTGLLQRARRPHRDESGRIAPRCGRSGSRAQVDGRRRRGSCRRAAAQSAGGGSGDAGLRESGRLVVILFPGLWRGRRTRPLRSDPAQGPVRDRRLLLQRQDHRLPAHAGSCRRTDRLA